MRVNSVPSSFRSRYSISRSQLEFTRVSNDLGAAATQPWCCAVINRESYWSPTCDDRKRTVAREVGGCCHKRRKEVALGRLITVSLILILATWGRTVDGAAPDDTAVPPSAATRQPPPAPPIKYLKAGARLFNGAERNNREETTRQLDLASKYLQAADRYRDMLEPDEQATLDAYLKELAKARAVLASQAAAPSAPAPAPTPSPSPMPAGVESQPSPTPAGVESQPSPTPAGVESQASPTPAGVESNPSPTPAGVESNPSPTPAGVESQPSPTPAGVESQPSPTPAGVESQPSPTPAGVEVSAVIDTRRGRV